MSKSNKPTGGETDPLVPKHSKRDDDDASGETESLSAGTGEDDNIFQSLADNFAEGMETFVEGAREIADEMIVNVQEEAQEVADAFVGDLKEADDGNEFFLEMTLTRELSILPSDVVQFAMDMPDNNASLSFINVDVEDPDEHRPFVAPKPVETPASAYVLLAATVIALSSFGPLLDLQQDCTGSMKTVWRQLGTSIVLAPLAFMDVRRNGLPKLSPPQMLTFFLAIVCYATMGIGFVVGLEYTSVGTAVILANSQAIILLLGKLFVGQRMTVLEATGAIFAFLGAISCSQDSASGAAAGEASNALLGDWIVFLCPGIGGVGYLVFAKSVRSHINLFPYMFLVMFIGCLLIVPFQIFVLHETVTFGTDIEYGIWGFLDPRFDRLPVELIQIFLR